MLEFANKRVLLFKTPLFHSKLHENIQKQSFVRTLETFFKENSKDEFWYTYKVLVLCNHTGW